MQFDEVIAHKYARDCYDHLCQMLEAWGLIDTEINIDSEEDGRFDTVYRHTHENSLRLCISEVEVLKIKVIQKGSQYVITYTDGDDPDLWKEWEKWTHESVAIWDIFRLADVVNQKVTSDYSTHKK